VFWLIGHYMIPSFMIPPNDNLVGGALASFDKYQGRAIIGEHSVFAVRFATPSSYIEQFVSNTD
jgi:hypothetical protein